jgi:alpha-D-xyloside xylohydrolase
MVSVDAKSGLATYTRVSDGRVMLQETSVAIAPPTERGASDLAVPTGTASVTFNGLEAGEGYYGFGEHRGSSRCDNQCVNTSLPIRSWDWNIQSSVDVEVLPNNGNAWVPFYQSSRGYGFLSNSAGYGTVHVGRDAVAWSVDATRQLDFWVTTSSAPKPAPPSATPPPPPPPYRDVMAHYAQATGALPPLAHEFSGFWQCKLRYSSEEQILRIAGNYSERNVSLSVIVIDYHHWVNDGDWRFNAQCWPTPAAMQSQLAASGVKLAVSVWPDVSTESLNWANMSARGLLIRGADGLPGKSVQGKYFVDAFNPATRAYLFDELMEGYGQYGIDTFWLDAVEPQGANIGNWYFLLDDGKTHRDVEVGMAWVQQYHRMVYDGLKARAPDGATLPPFLTRAAFAGSQRYGAILWSGDIKSNFNELATQVQVAQHVAMSGLPLWTTDIGGFRGGDTTDPVFRELIVRWFQFGAFCPIFRLHGNRVGNTPKDVDVCDTHGHNEVWSYGDVAYGAITKVMAVREALRPYVEDQIALASSHGTPVLRPMVFDFSDAECAAANDQYMFGPTFLVAPVLEYRATSRTVFLPELPAGEKWVDFFAGAASPARGPGTVTVATTDINVFPLFMRTAA